ncbi:MAG TPA: HIT domain-containing protein [Chloroflexia bacterium]|nr:HIT domain-containing protein [Chloroflexia bacterium]
MAYISGSSDEAGEKPGEQASGDMLQVEDAPQLESSGCVFCDRVRLPESNDRANLILLRSTHNFIILNLYPYNSAHLMIVPYRHTADLPSLDRETVAEMMALAQRMVRVIGAEYKPEGYNLGMNLGTIAGAGVAEHLHMHVVPRWAGDTNFMPVVGSTKVIPELLERTYDRLRERLKAIR